MTQELSAAKQLEKLQAAIENYRHGRNTLSPSGRLNKYKSKFVKGKKKVKGKWVWWDEKLNKAFDKKTVEQNLYHETIGTTTPLKDTKYLESKVKYDARVTQGPDPLRTKLSSPVSGSDTTVYESNWKSDLAKSEASLNKLKSGTSFARIEDKESLKELGNLTKGNEQNAIVTAQENPTPENQAIANNIYRANTDDPKGVLPFPVDQFKEYNPDLQYLNRTQDQNVAYDKGEKFQTDVKSVIKSDTVDKETLKIKDPKLTRAKLLVKRHASGKNSVALQKAKLYIREHGG
jgi:hypothetical protein